MAPSFGGITTHAGSLNWGEKARHPSASEAASTLLSRHRRRLKPLRPPGWRALKRHGRSDQPPDSNGRSVIDLLITDPDVWLAQRDRFSPLKELWGAEAQTTLFVDLVLHSCSEANRRAQEPGSVAVGMNDERIGPLALPEGIEATTLSVNALETRCFQTGRQCRDQLEIDPSPTQTRWW